MEVNGFTDFERVKSEKTFLWQSDDGPCCPFLYPLAVRVTCLCSIVNLTTVQCFLAKCSNRLIQLYSQQNNNKLEYIKTDAVCWTQLQQTEVVSDYICFHQM